MDDKFPVKDVPVLAVTLEWLMELAELRDIKTTFAGTEKKRFAADIINQLKDRVRPFGGLVQVTGVERALPETPARYYNTIGELVMLAADIVLLERSDGTVTVRKDVRVKRTTKAERDREEREAFKIGEEPEEGWARVRVLDDPKKENTQ